MMVAYVKCYVAGDLTSPLAIKAFCAISHTKLSCLSGSVSIAEQRTRHPLLPDVGGAVEPRLENHVHRLPERDQRVHIRHALKII